MRETVLRAVQRGIDAEVIGGDAGDIALAFISLIHGLAAAESAGWLAASEGAVERRWRLAVNALLAGFSGRNFDAAVV